MRVRTINSFYDLKEDVKREVGDEFNVSETRFDEIITKGGNWVEKITQEVPLKDLTKNELIKILDERKIEYSKKESKEELLKKLGE
jgi:hypothetical protein